MIYLSNLLLTLCVTACFYYIYSTFLVISFFKESVINQEAYFPPVTILKPLCGTSDELYCNLKSFCQQDYPVYQIIFSIRKYSDPSLSIVSRLIDEFPMIDISLVVNNCTIGSNLKISNLANAVGYAKHSILVLADSDIRVQIDYLRQVVKPLADERVGVVTCLYRSLTNGWLAAFEALGLSTQFHPTVLLARRLQGMHFAFGSTIVIRSQVLEEIGGFFVIADYLADDYQIGYLSAKAGYKIVLSEYVVDHQLDTQSLIEFFNRQLRWFRCIKTENTWGYLGLIFSYGTVVSVLFWITTGRSLIGWFVLFFTWSLRLIAAWIVSVCEFKDRVVVRYFLLIPIRDFVNFSIWLWGFFGNTIQWQGNKFCLDKNGKLLWEANKKKYNFWR